MIKTIFVFSVMLFPALVSAESCFPLYEKEAEAIQKRDGYTTNVGGQFYVANGNLGYFPGIRVNADIDNWAEDLVAAIKWGPYLYFARPDDPRKAWLETFRKAVKSECNLPQGDYVELRAMLKELMEDGSFCSQGQIIKPGFMGRKGPLKKVFEEAVQSGRFPQYCKSVAVKDDSTRETKDVSEREKSSGGSSSTSQQ